MRRLVGLGILLGTLIAAFALPGRAAASGASPSSIAFGNVPLNTTVTRDVTITADAGFQVQLASGSGINPPFVFDFDTCGAGGGFTGPGTCNVKQRYTPTALTSSSGTTNVFECPVAGGSCVAIPYSVSGTGISAASASPSTIAFGSVPLNTTVTRDVSITADAGYQVQLASGSGINPPFVFDFDTCGAGGGFSGPGTCNVKQRFTPTALTASSGTTNVFECPIAGGTCIPIPYSVGGTGISAASASPSSVAFGNVPLNTTATRDVTITADAGYQVQLASGSGINPPFAFDFDTCGAGGGFSGPGTCNVKQRFTPTALTASSGTTNVFECPIAGGSCIPIPYSVSGTGVSVASASPSTVAFGSVPIDTTASRDVSITADAGYQIQLASGSGINLPFAFDFDTCGAGGGFNGPGTCNVKQRFSPTALTTSTGTTNVFECPVGGGSCIAIPYSVSGTGALAASASPSSVDFGSVPVNTSVTRTVTLTLDGGYRFSGASGGGTAAPFGFSGDTCSAGGGFTGPGTCTFTERFTPTGLATSSQTLTLSECPVAGGACAPIAVPVKGTSVSVLAATPASLEFGSVPIGTALRLTATITVDTGYRISAGTGTGTAAPFGFELRTCDAFTGPGTCGVRETYTPSAIGPASASISVSECPIAGGACLPVAIPLHGTGGSGSGADPSSFDFGDVPVGSSPKVTVNVTVDPGYRIAGATGTALSAPFAYDPKTCTVGFTGHTCKISETFAPTAAGPASASLSISECPISGGGACIPIPVSFTGRGVKIATTLELTSSRNPSNFGRAITFTAKVTPESGGASALSGTVTFRDGSTVLGTFGLSGKKATFTTSSLAIGSHTITATYSGDAVNDVSSGTLTEVITS